MKLKRTRTVAGRVAEAIGFLLVALGFGLAEPWVGVAVGGALLVFLAQGVGE